MFSSKCASVRLKSFVLSASCVAPQPLIYTHHQRSAILPEPKNKNRVTAKKNVLITFCLLDCIFQTCFFFVPPKRCNTLKKDALIHSQSVISSANTVPARACSDHAVLQSHCSTGQCVCPEIHLGPSWILSSHSFSLDGKRHPWRQTVISVAWTIERHGSLVKHTTQTANPWIPSRVNLSVSDTFSPPLTESLTTILNRFGSRRGSFHVDSNTNYNHVQCINGAIEGVLCMVMWLHAYSTNSSLWGHLQILKYKWHRVQNLCCLP